jgi:uncharacterized protein YgbK (DUF1537 family)
LARGVTTLRLLADDLTGALDSAARFVPLVGTVPTFWVVPPALPATAAIDGGTRDTERAALGSAMANLAPLLDGADIAFKKIDSLLRGRVVAELNELADRFDWCILAPAFPFQGRITRQGRQLVRTDAGWRDVGIDLTDGVAGWGDRLMICDAETDADLDTVVARGRTLRGRLLWCGTGGLAGALAGRRPVPCPDLPRPILALIGSDHPVSVAQVAAVPGVHHVLHHLSHHASLPVSHHVLPKPPSGSSAAIARSLAEGAAVATVAVSSGASRGLALGVITAAFIDLLRSIKPPGTLMVSGGETLRALCGGLAASRLDVDGEIEPGVPTSVLRGGAFDGLRIVSKSGAFGGVGFLGGMLGR